MFTALAGLQLNFDFYNANFDWFMCCQMSVLIGLWEIRLSRACIKKIYFNQEVNEQNFLSFVELFLRNIL